MYSIPDYNGMIADRVRMEAYVRALRQTVRPGSVVVDIGTGTGIMALVACQLGARRVHAIEPDDAIHVARELAKANGMADRIVFHQEVSTRVTLPEKADVVVSDMRGWVPFCGDNLNAVADARQRFLAPGGRLIPLRDRLYAALVEAPKLYAPLLSGWESDGMSLDLQPARRLAVNALGSGRVEADQLRAEPVCWFELDYASAQNPNATGEAVWHMRQAARCHGAVVWFDSTLAEGVELSNAPDQPPLVYGRGFFPWTEPIELASGDCVRITFVAARSGQDYLWRWKTTVRQGSTGPAKKEFDQSTFFAVPLSPAKLARRAAGYIPARSAEAEIDFLILTRMDGSATQEQIAREVVSRFPASFKCWEDALTRVADLSTKYSR